MTCPAVRTVSLLAFAFVALGAVPAVAQNSDIVVRLDQLEHQMRQLTGAIEQLQYRNQQLEQSLRRVQEENEFRFQQFSGKPPASPAQVRPTGTAPAQPPQSVPLQQTPPSGRRSDAFDPTQNPGAPGAPRALGSLPANAPMA